MPPASGLGLKRKETQARIETALREATANPCVSLWVRPIRASAKPNAHAAALRGILATPIDLLVNGSSVTISPDQLGSTILRRRKGRPRARHRPAKLHDVLTPSLAGFEAAPVDARFTWSGPIVMIVPSTAGRVVDLAAATPAILAGQRQVPAPVVEQQPARNTDWAQRLNITEMVSTFTTNHAAGQPRVSNIHRACDLVNGTVVEPGQTFSLNGAIGPRSPERGFVEAPAFATDEGFFEAFGGGVSQFSTTVFNATFFSGYKDVKHSRTRSTSRLSLGREAALDSPGSTTSSRSTRAQVCWSRAPTPSRRSRDVLRQQEGKVVEAEGPIVLEQTPPSTECWTRPPPRARGASGRVGYRVIKQPRRPDRRERFF